MLQKNLLKLLFVLLLAPSLVFGQKKAPQMFDAANKFNTMWWLGSINYDKDLKFAIQSSDYGLLFNYRTLSFESLWINEGSMPESEFLSKSSQELIPSNQEAKFEFGFIDRQGKKSALKSSNELKDCQLIAAGRYFQKRFLNNFQGTILPDTVISGLDFAAFPDCFNLLYRFVPVETSKGQSLYMDFELPAAYSKVTKDANGYVVCSQSNGMGFIIMPSAESSSLTLNGNTIAIQTLSSSLTKGNEYEVGLTVYPFLDIKKGIAMINAGLNSGLQIEAQMAEDNGPRELDINYKENEGFFEIVMSEPVREERGGPRERDQREEREEMNTNRPSDMVKTVDFSITNSSSVDQIARLNFNYPTGGFATSGVSSVLCDENGMPIGIPTQITKNWHRKAGNFDRYQGPWISMYTTLTVPANTTLKLQHKQIAAFWGLLPAVSHAQLALPGWGSSHQLWEQSAMGSWGENLCYSPDGNVGSAIITDVRTVYTDGPNKPFSWGGNVGGGDFIYLTDDNNNRMHHENIRVERKRYAPNLAEMVYSGDIADGALSFEYSTMLGRTDDMIKGYYTIKVKANKDIKFNQIAFFQTGAYRYHMGISNKISYGTKNGLVKTWDAKNDSPLMEYVGSPIKADANSSWIALTDTHFNPNNLNLIGKLTACKGVIVRDWNARIGGKNKVAPYWREVTTGSEGNAVSIMNLTVPEKCKELKAGDYIETTVEFLVYQEVRGEYCGPNEKFASALEANPDSWFLTQREAQQNEITASLTKGEVVRNYPLMIKAEDNKVEGSLVGGLAYATVTITGLTEYANPVFYVKHNDTWEVVDQAIRGNDFWQSNYNVEDQCWEITYNIPMDRDDYKKPCGIKFEFK